MLRIPEMSEWDVMTCDEMEYVREMRERNMKRKKERDCGEKQTENNENE